MVRFLTRFSMLAAIAVGTPGCTDPIAIDNAVPRLTWLAATPTDDPDIVELTLWISDIEGDTVDVDATWLAGGESGEVAQAPGSYGLVGLPTREALLDPVGQPHTVLWDVSDVPSGDVSLRLVPDDRPYENEGLGVEVTTPAFDLGVGLPEAISLSE